MDQREFSLVKFAVEKSSHSSSAAELLQFIIKKDQELHPGNEYFKDQAVFGTGSVQSNAMDLVLKVVGKPADQDDEDYLKYKDFFDEHLKDAKKDIISGEFLAKEAELWQPVLSYLNAIKSYANGKGLKMNRVEMHLDRYIKTKPSEILINIPKWDGLDRVKELGKFVKLKNQDYSVFEDAFKEWLANIFRRLYTNGAQNRCIILKGDQGIGKDQLVHNLLSSFEHYYAKFTNVREEKDIWSQVNESLVLHIEEFDQTGRLGVAFLKDLITRDFAKYRQSYGKRNQTRKCHASFISTVNIDAILRDETGNRRFAVFEIESIDWKYPKDWADQILAQAHQLYVDGYRASSETWSQVMHTNAQFEQVDMVPELLNLWESRTRKLITDEKKGMPFATIEGVVSDMAKACGWKTKSILTMLKTNGRSKHTKVSTMYWPTDQRKPNLLIVPDNNSEQKKPIINYAPGNDGSTLSQNHPIDHHLTTEDPLPF